MFSWNRPQPSTDRPSGNPPPEATRPTHARAEAVPALPEVATPNRRFTDGTSVCATRLGRLQIRGTLTSTESVEFGGTFEGPVEVEGLFKVAEGGHVTGTIRAQDAVIAGEVRGHVTVRGRLELGAKARVLADVEAKAIAIAEGAFVAGRVAMPGGNAAPVHGNAAPVDGNAAPVHAPQTTSFKEKRRDRKKARRAAAAAAAAAAHHHDAAPSEPVELDPVELEPVENEAQPQADGDPEPPAGS
jgi:cytoskeletal protein CcmA (bactofilin family)